MELLNYRVVVQLNDSADGSVTAGIADVQHITTLFQNGIAGFLIERRNVLHLKADGHFLAFAGVQFFRLGKSHQYLIRLIQLPLGNGHIKLYHFLAGAFAGVGHLGSHGNLAAIKHRILRYNLKAGIAQSKAEGEHGIFVHGIKVAVANIDALTVVGIVGITEITHMAVIFPLCPGACKFAGGVRLAQQHIRKSIANGNTQLGQEQNVGYFIHHRRKIHDTAHIQHQQKALVLLLQPQNIPNFGISHFQIALFRGTVSALAADSAQDIDSGVAFTLQREFIFRFLHNGTDAQHDGAQAFRRNLSLDTCFEFLVCLGPDSIITVKPRLGGNGKTGIFQTFLNAHIMAHIHVTGAGTALDGLSCRITIDGDFSGCVQRETAIRFQQDHTLRSDLTHPFDMLNFVALHIHFLQSISK